jgi:hypothetical protein
MLRIAVFFPMILAAPPLLNSSFGCNNSLQQWWRSPQRSHRMKMQAVPVIVVAACLTAGVTAQAAEPRTAKAIFDRATQVAAGAETWPGFDFRRYAALTTDGTSGAGSVRFSNATGDKDRQLFMVVTDEYYGSHSLEEDLSITFHEAFHGFQRDPARPGARWGAENALLVFDYGEASPRNAALFRIESRALLAALEAGDPDGVRRHVREFLAVRRLRQGELDARLVAFEKGAESNEGLAEYAGEKGVLAAMQAVRDKKLGLTLETLDPRERVARKYGKLRTVTELGKNPRLRFYYTGSAQAFLLDRLLPAWKDRVQTKAAVLQDLLAEAVGSEGVTIALAEAALRRQGYDAVLKEEEALAVRRRSEAQALLDSILTKAGRRCTLDLMAVGGMGKVGSFDPMNVTSLGQRRIHTRMLNVSEDGRFKAEFSQPVVQDFEHKTYDAVIPAGEKLTVTVDGAPLDLSKPSEQRFEKKLTVSAPRLTMDAADGTVTVTDRGLVIRLAKK